MWLCSWRARYECADNPVEPENLIAAALDAAEEIRDALDGLTEKTATDPDAPFGPDALARLAALKQDDRAAFEALRAKLKKAGCRVTPILGQCHNAFASVHALGSAIGLG
jgi:hypothetical protein